LATEWKDLNAAIGVLAGDSSNIVDVIQKTYSVCWKSVFLSNRRIPNFKFCTKKKLNLAMDNTFLLWLELSWYGFSHIVQVLYNRHKYGL